jgi:hypothetical protein
MLLRTHSKPGRARFLFRSRGGGFSGCLRGFNPSRIRRLAFRFVTRDQASAGLKRYPVPQPVEGDREAVSQADQKVDMRDAPEEPARKAGQCERADLDDGGLASDRCEVAFMPLPERSDILPL